MQTLLIATVVCNSDTCSSAVELRLGNTISATTACFLFRVLQGLKVVEQGEVNTSSWLIMISMMTEIYKNRHVCAQSFTNLVKSICMHISVFRQILLHIWSQDLSVNVFFVSVCSQPPNWYYDCQHQSSLLKQSNYKCQCTACFSRALTEAFRDFIDTLNAEISGAL